MTPVKPFDSYKWRWLSVAPTESLLNPPIFLGVLRVLARHDGQAPSAPAVATELAQVQADTNSPVDLVRTPERNLIRNSGQYWKGTGLLAPQDGEIRLTSLGRQIAEGKVTQGEFAAIMIQQTVLPNPWTYTAAEIARWTAADLAIKPFQLILAVMNELGSRAGKSAGYLTPPELIHVVIPLAGNKVASTKIADDVMSYRKGFLDVSSWPDCAPQANDHRLAREFLLFLSNFGICRHAPAARRENEKFFLDEPVDAAAVPAITGATIFAESPNTEEVISAIRHSTLPSIIERRRTTITVLSRPAQSRFRERTLLAFNGKCFLTGERISEVLEAAHIVPVEHGGADEPNNGLCLRVDVHRLFDSGNIRWEPNGDFIFSDAVKGSGSYGELPSNIAIPPFVNPANILWRKNYY